MVPGQHFFLAAALAGVGISARPPARRCLHLRPCAECSNLRTLMDN